jgi:hypothetical protein
MSLAIQIKGLDALEKKLANLEDFAKWARPPMEESIDGLHERVQKYPPPKPTYIRTFTLQRSIVKEIEVNGRTVKGRVYSTGANQGRGQYEQFVKVRETQAWMHVGHWPTTAADLTAEQKTIEGHFQDAIDKVLK